MEVKTIIVAGFPGVGKTYLFNNYKDSDSFIVLDSDSSDYSWIKDENGKNTTTRNPRFPGNYIDHIKYNIGKADLILVSTHKEVLDALDASGITYIIAFPNENLKEDYLKRYKDRGNDDKFIKLLSDNMDEWIGQIRDRIENNDNVAGVEFTNPYTTLADNKVIRHIQFIGL